MPNRAPEFTAAAYTHAGQTGFGFVVSQIRPSSVISPDMFRVGESAPSSGNPPFFVWGEMAED
jgi:hypothetical protein